MEKIDREVLVWSVVYWGAVVLFISPILVWLFINLVGGGFAPGKPTIH